MWSTTARAIQEFCSDGHIKAFYRLTWSVHYDKPTVRKISLIYSFMSIGMVCTTRFPGLSHSAGGSRSLLWPPARLGIGNFLTHRQLSLAFFPHSKFGSSMVILKKHFSDGKMQNFFRQSNRAGLPIFSLFTYYVNSF